MPSCLARRRGGRLLQEAGGEYGPNGLHPNSPGDQLARPATDIGPALPRPHHARGEAAEEVSLLLVAVMPQVKLMAVMVAVVMTAAMSTAMTAAMPAARGRIACGRE